MPSKLQMFGRLYKKELRELRPEIGFLVGLVIAIDIAFMLASSKQPGMPPVVLGPLVMALSLSGVLPVLSSFRLLHREWTGHTIYLTLSLPVGGAMIIGARLLALLTEFLGGALASGISMLWLAYPFIVKTSAQVPELKSILSTPEFHNVFWMGLAGFGLGLAGMVYIIAVSLLSGLIGRLVSRFQGLVTLVSFFLIAYLGGNIIGRVATALVGNVGSYTVIDPVTALRLMGTAAGKMGTISLVHLAMAAVIFVLAVAVWDRCVEL